MSQWLTITFFFLDFDFLFLCICLNYQFIYLQFYINLLIHSFIYLFIHLSLLSAVRHLPSTVRFLVLLNPDQDLWSKITQIDDHQRNWTIQPWDQLIFFLDALLCEMSKVDHKSWSGSFQWTRPWFFCSWSPKFFQLWIYFDSIRSISNLSVISASLLQLEKWIFGHCSYGSDCQDELTVHDKNHFRSR